MSALTAIEAEVTGVTDASEAGDTGFGRRSSGLQVVLNGAAPGPAGRPVRTAGAAEPRSSSSADVTTGHAARVLLPGKVLAPEPAVPQARVAAPPVRLTRRGRMVVSVLVLAVLVVAALLISLLASGGAQATNHGQARAGYQGMREVVVRPGQTLWSIAVAAEPTADTRIVVQEIMTANALTSANISAGQLIWVPR